MPRKTSGLFDNLNEKDNINDMSTSNIEVTSRKTSGLFDKGTTSVEKYTKSLNENLVDIEISEKNNDN